MSDSLIIPCVSCATLNRVPRERLGDVPVCAGCREQLVDGEPRTIDAKTFERLVASCDLPVVVDFWAAWCGPCRQMAPEFASAARQLRGRALLVKLDTEAEPGIAARHQIQSIPTMVAFRRGSELARTSGALPAARIVDWVEQIA